MRRDAHYHAVGEIMAACYRGERDRAEDLLDAIIAAVREDMQYPPNIVMVAGRQRGKTGVFRNTLRAVTKRQGRPICEECDEKMCRSIMPDGTEAWGCDLCGWSFP